MQRTYFGAKVSLAVSTSLKIFLDLTPQNSAARISTKRLCDWASSLVLPPISFLPFSAFRLFIGFYVISGRTGSFTKQYWGQVFFFWAFNRVSIYFYQVRSSGGRLFGTKFYRDPKDADKPTSKIFQGKQAVYIDAIKEHYQNKAACETHRTQKVRELGIFAAILRLESSQASLIIMQKEPEGWMNQLLIYLQWTALRACF